MSARLPTRLKALSHDELAELAAEAMLECPIVARRKAEEKMSLVAPVPEWAQSEKLRARNEEELNALKKEKSEKKQRLSRGSGALEGRNQFVRDPFFVLVCPSCAHFDRHRRDVPLRSSY